MIWKVRWLREARDYIAAMFMAADAPKREAIALAFKHINSQLETNPLDCGESREEGRRIHFELPLGIIYKVYPEANEVRVMRVWDCERAE